ncbi:unnamed protein product [Owenia fusiformis]|uniref:unspecific monooxygenase n=1 Tax=Owenia fusiformis TaxID=6347 RepID=A0A8J1TB18_OWEFU|nr:unnamed protein product [Owenia fusiformis]
MSLSEQLKDGSFDFGKLTSINDSVAQAELLFGVAKSVSRTGFTLVSSALILSLLALLTIVWSTKDNKYGHLPGPLRLPLLGNLLQIGLQPHKSFTQLRKKFGDVYRVYIGGYPVIVLNGHESIKQALIHQGEDFAGRPHLPSLSFLSEGKSMAFGDYSPMWKLQHKVALASLRTITKDNEYGVEELIQSETQRLLQKLLESSGTPHNPMPDIFDSVCGLIYKLCYGINPDDEDQEHLIKINHDIMEFQIRGNPADFIPWTKKLIASQYNSYVTNCNTMFDVCNRKENEHWDTYDDTKKRSILDAIIRANNNISEADKLSTGLTKGHVLHIIQDFLGAGTHAVTFTLCWAILYMVINQDVQAKVQKEIDDVIMPDEEPSTDHMTHMPYTTACIWEVYRFASSVPLALPHYTTKNTTLNGLQIPKDTTVLVNLWSINRSEELWRNPDQFNPDRFIDKDGDLIRSKMDLVKPFSYGKRRCSGENLGKLEVFLIFVSLLRSLHISPVQDTKYSLDAQFGLALKPQDFEVVVTKRK